MNPFFRNLFLISSLILVSSNASASDPFGKLVCKKTISDSGTVQNSKDTLNFKWTARGGNKVFPLLRKLASKEISDKLLQAYDSIEVEVNAPMDSCSFGNNPHGKFICSYDKPLEITLKAKVWSFDKDSEVDIYKGKISQLKLGTNFFKKGDFSSVSFQTQLKVTGDKNLIKLVSADFFTQEWESEGIKQNPACKVDGEFLVY